MDAIKNAINKIQIFTNKQNDNLLFHKLKADGLGNITPRDYQLYGIEWLTHSWLQRQDGGVILGDEMGLGKTLQSVAFSLHLVETHQVEQPILILAPLSVIDGWKQEFARSAPSLKVIIHIGDKDSREERRQSISDHFKSNNWTSEKPPFNVLVTSYEICLKDHTFLEKFKWSMLIVDEAHRLKNAESLLHQTLKTLDMGFKVLLTGTPVQNNLKELYSLLSFTSPDIFSIEKSEDFVDYFSTISEENSKLKKDLHKMLKPFLLRRTKNEVVLDLPRKSEVVLYTGMTKEQKKLYKTILTKDISAFNQETGQQTRLLNVLMQLRKCCNHPYIFPGVEPEPFELGEHLIETSGKLVILDKLLKFLKKGGHKVLIFSQMTTMLDIVQDYLGYREYTYERLDGSVRGEERFLAVNNFNATSDTFIFLLSTRAGGQGLNLMTADTVIFLDNDFNPQNDLQAAARAHRIGQTRPVKIIRLVSKNTVEEIILKRAEQKLKLTNSVVEGGQFSSVKTDEVPIELNNILKFGLDDLFNQDSDEEKEVNLEKLVGKTSNGCWSSTKESGDDAKQTNVQENEQENMYVYEGQDYSNIASEQDKNTFENFVKTVTDAIDNERSLRKNPKPTVQPLFDLPNRKRKTLTEDEKRELKAKREENKAKRMKLMEEKRADKLKKLRESHNYESCKIELPDNDSDDNESLSSETEDSSVATENEDDRQISYVVGDLMQPKNLKNRDRIICHCVDDSGVWGRGGLFTAMEKISSVPRTQYELASKVKDLETGDVHLIMFKEATKTDPSIYVALIVAHTRDRNNRLSPILMSSLSEALEKLYHVAKTTGASIHFPRIGYNTPKFNWYGTEKLIKKMLAQRGIKTLVYYYRRRGHNNKPSTSASSQQQATTTSTIASERTDPSEHYISTLSDTSSKETSPTAENNSPESNVDLAEIFQNCTMYFHDFKDSDELKKLSRYIIAYDGDVDKTMTSYTTHIITSGDVIDSNDLKNFKETSLPVVSKDWISECVRKGNLVDVKDFVVDLSSSES